MFTSELFEDTNKTKTDINKIGTINFGIFDILEFVNIELDSYKLSC